MPTFTAIALDRLLEPGSRYPSQKPPPAPPQQTPITVERPQKKPPSGRGVPSLPNIRPALYATPETTSLPDSPSSFPPYSPYIINHKRRGPRLLKSLSQTDVPGTQSGDVVQKAESGVGGSGVETVAGGSDDRKIDDELKVEYARSGAGEAVAPKFEEGSLKDASTLGDGISGVHALTNAVCGDAERDTETEDFFDPQDSLSIASSTEFDDGSSTARWRLGTSLGEYYDAVEEISSDGTARSLYPNIEDELREMRLNLLTEIEKRKQAEEALENLQNKWQTLSHHLSLVGLTLPATSTIQNVDDCSQCVDPVEDLCQQVVISRVVADAVGRACSRADVEMEMQPQIESKNFEIARLWDRLHYYEAANREMSQRNQEAIEMARQRRHMRRKRRQIWFWGSVGLVFTLGAAAVAWSYVPGTAPSTSEGGDSEESQ